jgi:hypothetical protein
MSDNQNPGFGQFVPGFDFLQNLAKGASQALPQMPNLSNWVAPTMNVDELDKRIGELRSVLFWLDQNSRALGATIQALELQKMTLATLKGMNFNMGDLADAMKLKPADKTADKAANGATDKTADKATTGVVDPLQWWSALTQQFQQIATDAMKDTEKMAADMAGSMAVAGKTASAGAARKAPAAKKTARKTGARTR